MRKSTKPQGWTNYDRYQSHRHSLAAKGISTTRKTQASAGAGKGMFYPSHLNYSFPLLSPYLIDAKSNAADEVHFAALHRAESELPSLKSKTQLRDWFTRHKSVLSRSGIHGIKQLKPKKVKLNYSDTTAHSFRIILPRFDNSGSPIKASERESIAKQMAKHFGGVSAHRITGFWLAHDNTLMGDDNVLLFSSRLSNEKKQLAKDRKFMQTIAKKAGRRFGQESIMLEETPVDEVDFVAGARRDHAVSGSLSSSVESLSSEL